MPVTARNQTHTIAEPSGGIWLTATIGVAAGLGHEAAAVLTTGFALVSFLLMPRNAVAFPPYNADWPRSPASVHGWPLA